MKRLLNFQGADFLNASPLEIKQAILASEGRVIVSESVVTYQPYVNGLTNAEIEKAFGADILLLNVLDLNNPKIEGVPEGEKNHIAWLKKATSRPLGINLEPVDENAIMTQGKEKIASGRKASIENYKKANDYDLELICLTGNPATGVTIKQFYKRLEKQKKTLMA